MPATQSQIALAKAFEPVLLFHRDELYQPVDAKRWFESSTLWPSQAPFDIKSSWGFSPPPPGIPPGPVFPRVPLLRPGQASLAASETRAGQTFVASDRYKFLQTAGDERELFLELGGWLDSDWATPSGHPEADVTGQSFNGAANLAAVRDVVDGDKFARFRVRYAVEIVETNAVERIVLAIGRGVDLMALLRSVLRAPRLILYYFLYPGHEQALLGCETAVGAGRNANFSGDGGCVTVLLDGDAPAWIGHTTHNSGLVEAVVDSTRVGMLVSPWRDARRDGQHPFVFVSKGTHGHYLSAGDKERPSFSPGGIDVSKTSCGAVEDAYNALRDAIIAANETLGLADTATDAVVSLAKVAAGAAIAGPFGALVGGFASLAEAAASDPSSLEVPRPLPAAGPVDQLPVQTGPNATLVGRAIVPQGMVLPPDIQALETLNWASSEITADNRTYPFVVLRPEQPWWPASEWQDEAGYEGRWGTRVQADKMDRRCGMQFPNFRAMFFREFFLKLSSP